MISFEFNSYGDSVVLEKKYFENDFGRLRDICVSPDGKIYLATNGNLWTNTNPFTHSIIELSNNSYVPNATNDHTDLQRKVSIWPNPITTNQQLHIELPNGQQGEFIVYDQLGRACFTKDVTGSGKMNLKLNKGIYFWKLLFKDASYTSGKLVVN